ncbi:MAG: helix-turn-helix transcriptional regulator [Bacilli bacterium]|nr:helix-turn-helix transcriptional regulator [Bacilli bacterium]
MTNSKTYNIYNVIGKNIKKYRKLQGMTQRELAESLLLSDSFIAKLESITPQTLSIDTLELIAKKLKAPITSFFDENVMKEK